MAEYIEKPDMQYILHIKSDKKVEKRLIDYCLESVVDVFEDTGLTADVQPVKHGRWERDEQYVQCSECGLNLDTSGYIEPEWRDILNFCPCCGARMDGEQV